MNYYDVSFRENYYLNKKREHITKYMHDGFQAYSDYLTLTYYELNGKPEYICPERTTKEYEEEYNTPLRDFEQWLEEHGD